MSRRGLTSGAFAALLLATTTVPALADVPATSPAPSAGNAWTEIDHQRPAGANTYLYDVVSVGPEDVWAVGYRYATVGGVLEFRTYGQHCLGTTCTPAVLPNLEAPPLTTNMLNGIGAGGPEDIWAVGSARTPSGVTVALTVHYDGRTWSIVDAPEQPGATDNFLQAVAVGGPGSVLAVGSYYASFDSRPLAMEWTDVGWRLVPVPAQKGCVANIRLTDVAVADGVYHVSGSCRTDTGQETGFVLRRTRGQWASELAPSDPVLPRPAVLTGVAVVPGSGVWVVGSSTDSATQSTVGVTLNNAGGGWQSIPVPQVKPLVQPIEVAGAARNRVFTVGVAAQGAFAERLSLYWGGRRYVNVPAGQYSSLYGVTYDPAGYWWAVGHDLGESVIQRIAAR